MHLSAAGRGDALMPISPSTHRVRQLVITSLATLGTVLLFGWVNHGLVVIAIFV